MTTTTPRRGLDSRSGSEATSRRTNSNAPLTDWRRSIGFTRYVERVRALLASEPDLDYKAVADRLRIHFVTAIEAMKRIEEEDHD